MNQAKILPQTIMEIFPRFMHFLRNEMRGDEENDLSMPQMATLGAIRRGQETVGQIAHHHGVSQPAVSNLIDSLVKKGFIERITDEKDRRQIQLRLTTRGRAFSDKAQQRIHSRLAEKLSLLSENDQKALAEGIAVLGRII